MKAHSSAYSAFPTRLMANKSLFYSKIVTY